MSRVKNTQRTEQRMAGQTQDARDNCHDVALYFTDIPVRVFISIWIDHFNAKLRRAFMNLIEYGEMLAKSAKKKPKTNKEKAMDWIKANPVAFKTFEVAALEAAEKGEIFSVKRHAENLRWQKNFEVIGNPKINNTRLAYIAQSLVDSHPVVKPFIRQRKAS